MYHLGNLPYFETYEFEPYEFEKKPTELEKLICSYTLLAAIHDRYVPALSATAIFLTIPS